MNHDNLLLSVAITAVIIAIIGVSVTYDSISTFNNFLTGFATESGIVDVEVQTTASINISSANGTAGKTLNWGPGAFDSGVDYVTLVSNGSVVGGTWANVTEGFIVENVGNVNVTVGISASALAATFLGTSSDGAVDPAVFQYNVTDSEENSCGTYNTGYTSGTFVEFATSNVAICDEFDYTLASNSMRIDVLLGLPKAANIGALENTVVLTYAAS